VSNQSRGTAGDSLKKWYERGKEPEELTGNRKQETGNRKQETGNRKQETGNRKQRARCFCE
jgi:hypothetical protein